MWCNTIVGPDWIAFGFVQSGKFCSKFSSNFIKNWVDFLAFFEDVYSGFRTFVSYFVVWSINLNMAAANTDDQGDINMTANADDTKVCPLSFGT